MSLWQKSEIRLRLGSRHCDAGVWSAGLMPREQARLFFEGQGDSLIDLALDDLNQSAPLPERAQIWVEDELAYLLTLPADSSAKAARAKAQAYFADILGEDEALLVDISLTPCGSRWIVAAIYASQVDEWQHSLRERGLSLERVSLALTHDLQRLQSQVPASATLLALVRSEGVSLVALSRGAVYQVSWERCDVDDLPVLQSRIQAHLDQMSGSELQLASTVHVVPLHPQQLTDLSAHFAPMGWQVHGALLSEQG